MRKNIRLIAVALCLVILAVCGAGCVRTNNATRNNKADTTANSATAITEEQAKAIALERAGLMEDEVIFDRVEFDRDDGVDHYEVEFQKDRTEYDADISAADGTFLSWEVDFND